MFLLVVLLVYICDGGVMISGSRGVVGGGSSRSRDSGSGGGGGGRVVAKSVCLPVRWVLCHRLELLISLWK